MISCTEFIPLYSEFFKYLEKRGGPEAVMAYWIHISDTSIGNKTNPNSLASKCEKYGGFDGAIAYWAHTLKEEACDVLRIYDYKNRFTYSHMRHCPSRGMLNALEHVEPYHNYCDHCNVLYARVLEPYGVCCQRDNSKIDRAECRTIRYEEGHAPDFNWRNITDEEVKKLAAESNADIVDMKAEDNKYLHRDFHLSGDNALAYCGKQFGDEAVREFLTDYVRYYYAPNIQEFRKNGLKALCAWIEKVYETEEASHVLHTELTDTSLTVTIDRSPVIEYMHSLNQEPSEYYIEETRTLYAVIAELSGMDFRLHYYKEDGAARFDFCMKQ